MFTDSVKTQKYQKLSEDESMDGSLIQPPQKKSKLNIIYKSLPWVLLVVLSIIYATHWYLHLRHSIKSSCFDEDLLSAPIVWEEKTYRSNIDGDLQDIYSMDSPNVEEAWEAVRYEHVTAITAEEMARLPGHRKSAKLYGGQEGNAVLLEVFHQIHCLDAIRQSYFGNVTVNEGEFGGSSMHVDHCFSYLLQSLLCHADVGVMTTRWIESNQDFAANFNVTRTCRNFDVIKKWAEGRRALYDTPGQKMRLHNSR